MAAARALLQFPPEVHGEVPQPHSWLARLEDHVGYVQQGQAPERSHVNAIPASGGAPGTHGPNGPRSSVAQAPPQCPEEGSHAPRTRESTAALRESGPVAVPRQLAKWTVTPLGARAPLQATIFATCSQAELARTPVYGWSAARGSTTETS